MIEFDSITLQGATGAHRPLGPKKFAARRNLSA
jgi:hypothetical protein